MFGKTELVKLCLGFKLKPEKRPLDWSSRKFNARQKEKAYSVVSKGPSLRNYYIGKTCLWWPLYLVVRPNLKCTKFAQCANTRKKAGRNLTVVLLTVEFFTVFLFIAGIYTIGISTVEYFITGIFVAGIFTTDISPRTFYNRTSYL